MLEPPQSIVQNSTVAVDGGISADASVYAISGAKKLTSLLKKKLGAASVPTEYLKPITPVTVQQQIDKVEESFQLPAAVSIVDYQTDIENSNTYSSSTVQGSMDRVHRLEEMMSSAANISDLLHERHPQLTELYNQQRKIMSEKIHGGLNFDNSKVKIGLRQDIAANTPSSILAAARSVLKSTTTVDSS